MKPRQQVVSEYAGEVIAQALHQKREVPWDQEWFAHGAIWHRGVTLLALGKSGEAAALLDAAIHLLDQGRAKYNSQVRDWPAYTRFRSRAEALEECARGKRMLMWYRDAVCSNCPWKDAHIEIHTLQGLWWDGGPSNALRVFAKGALDCQRWLKDFRADTTDDPATYLCWHLNNLEHHKWGVYYGKQLGMTNTWWALYHIRGEPVHLTVTPELWQATQELLGSFYELGKRGVPFKDPEWTPVIEQRYRVEWEAVNLIREQIILPLLSI